MKINNKVFNLSLNDCTELRKLIIENPDLPLLIFADENAYDNGWMYSQCQVDNCEIKELTLCDDGCWRNEDDYGEYLNNAFINSDVYPEYVNINKKEYQAMINKKIEETVGIKAIVVLVG